MSFGFGVGDIAAAVNLARTVYKKFRDSRNQYKELAADAQDIANILDDFDDLVKECQLKPDKERRLLECGASTRDTLQDAEKLLDKYKNMSSKSRGVVDRLGWDYEDARDVRSRMTNTKTSLSTLYSSLILSEFVQMQKNFNLYLDEVRQGHRDTDSLMLIAAGGKSNRKSAWPVLIKELKSFGLTSDVIFENRPFIVDLIRTAFDDGRLKDIPVSEEALSRALENVSLLQSDHYDHSATGESTDSEDRGIQASLLREEYVQPGSSNYEADTLAQHLSNTPGPGAVDRIHTTGDNAEHSNPTVRFSMEDRLQQQIHSEADGLPVQQVATSPAIEYLEGIWSRRASFERIIRTGDCMTLSKDGKLLAIMTGFFLSRPRIYDACNGKLLRELRLFTTFNEILVFSPRDTWLLALSSWKTEVILWDSSKDTPKLKLTGDGHHANSVQFSADGNLLFSASNRGPGGLRVWNPDTGDLLYRWTDLGHIRLLTVSPDDAFLAFAQYSKRSGSWISVMKRAEPNTPALLHKDFITTMPKGIITVLVWSPDGSMLACGTESGTIELFKVKNGILEHRQLLKGHRDEIYALSFSNRGTLLASGGAGEGMGMRIWDTQQGCQLYESQSKESEWITCLVFSPDDQHLMVGSLFGGVRLWNIVATQSGHTLKKIER